MFQCVLHAGDLLIDNCGFCKFHGKLILEKFTFMYECVRPRNTKLMRLSVGQWKQRTKRRAL